jgi:response regulator RpfG family c-di-GMP phosphodiesterase
MSAVRAHVLSIQDNESDTRLLQQVWGEDSEIKLTCRGSGALGMEHLQTEDERIPNLILLASRFVLSQMPALEVLAALKADDQLRCIPVVVLTGAYETETIDSFYDAHAACVVEMPSGLDELKTVLATAKAFWLGVARLPRETKRAYHIEDCA